MSNQKMPTKAELEGEYSCFGDFNFHPARCRICGYSGACHTMWTHQERQRQAMEAAIQAQAPPPTQLVPAQHYQQPAYEPPPPAPPQQRPQEIHIHYHVGEQQQQPLHPLQAMGFLPPVPPMTPPMPPGPMPPFIPFGAPPPFPVENQEEVGRRAFAILMNLLQRMGKDR